MDLGLKGRSAVVTGASKGIGLGVAQVLAAEGCARVHIVSRTREALEAAAKGLRDRHGTEIKVHALDLSKRGSAAALLAATGTPDILVNNAGAIPAGDIERIDEDTWREAWELKVFGYINLSRAYYAAMSKAGRGVILNVTGLAAERHDYGYIAGTTGNAGLNAFTRALGSYSLERGVRVLAVCPGLTETERLVTLLKTGARQRTGSEDGWRDAYKGAPMQRAAMVEEVANVVAFLASDRASYMSGTVVTVDGGHGARNGNFPKQAPSP